MYVYDPKYANEIAESLASKEYSFPKIGEFIWKDLKKTNFDLKGKFKDFDVPTLIIDGRQDFLGEAVPLEIHKNIPNSKLVFLDKSSHYPWLDAPKEYFNAIEEFVGRNVQL